MNSTTIPNTNVIAKWMNVGLDKSYQKYFFSGYLSLQRTVNEFAIWRTSNRQYTANITSYHQCSTPSSTSWDILSMPMPIPAYSQNPFFVVIGFLLGLIMAMSFLYPASRYV